MFEKVEISYMAIWLNNLKSIRPWNIQVLFFFKDGGMEAVIYEKVLKGKTKLRKAMKEKDVIQQMWQNMPEVRPGYKLVHKKLVASTVLPVEWRNESRECEEWQDLSTHHVVAD